MDDLTSDLSAMVALDALLQEGSVTGAAQRLGISQPAMSARLAGLRRRFDDPLFVQTGRRFTPTTKAERLKAPLRAALAELDGVIRAEQAFEPATATETFRIIAADYDVLLLSPPLTARLGAAAPGLRIAFQQAEKADIWRRLEEGEADAALMAAPKFADAMMRPVLEEGFVLAQRKDHPRGVGPVTLDEIARYPAALVSTEGGGFEGAADRALTAEGRSRRVQISLPTFLSAAALVASGDHLCLLPARLAQAEAHRIDAFAPPFPTPQFTVSLVWHPRRTKDPAHVWLRDRIAEIYAGL